MLGQNVKLNSGGNNTILDSGHRTAGILLDARNHGAITFLTGAANAATENVKIDSSGRMLLGTTTEGEGNADDLTVATSGHTGMTIRSGTANRGNIYFSDGTAGDAEYRGYITYDHDGDKLKLGTANADRLLITSNGAVTVSTTGYSDQYSYSMKLGQTNYSPSGTTSPHYGLWVRQLGPRYALNYGVYSEVEDDAGFYGGETVDGLTSVRGVGVYGLTPTSSNAYQKGIGVYGKATNASYNYNTTIGVRGRAEAGTTAFLNNNGQKSYGGHFVATGKANVVGVYADAFLAGSPGAGEEAIPLLVASNGSEKLRVTSAGILTIPDQCGFHIIHDGNGSPNTGNMISNWDTDASSSRSYIKNCSFNSGRFVAPVAGLYFFTSQLLLSNVAANDDSIHVFWTKGSSNSTFTYWNTRTDGQSANGYMGYGGYLPVTGSTTVYLTANEIFGMGIVFGGDIDVYGVDANWGHWSGYLVG